LSNAKDKSRNGTQSFVNVKKEEEEEDFIFKLMILPLEYKKRVLIPYDRIHLDFCSVVTTSLTTTTTTSTSKCFAKSLQFASLHSSQRPTLKVS
jgi:hypothetical protein